MPASAKEVREFARANGLAVGARGQFSRTVIDAFNKGKRAEKRYVKPSERTA
jgi:hypothetical protein